MNENETNSRKMVYYIFSNNAMIDNTLRMTNAKIRGAFVWHSEWCCYQMALACTTWMWMWMLIYSRSRTHMLWLWIYICICFCSRAVRGVVCVCCACCVANCQCICSGDRDLHEVRVIDLGFIPILILISRHFDCRNETQVDVEAVVVEYVGFVVCVIVTSGIPLLELICRCRLMRFTVVGAARR